MSHKIELPQPWVEIETITEESRDNLERSIGTGLSYEDLTDDDVYRDGAMTTPRSERSRIVMNHKWVRLKNTEDGTEVILRLQLNEGQHVAVTSVSFTATQDAREISGSALRGFPVSAIAAAYSYDEQAGSANLTTFLELINEYATKTDALEALPPASNTSKFSAMVARQYRAIEAAEPTAYAAKRMSEINGKPLPTVQRWITQARKSGFLPPARTGRRPKNG